MGAALLLLFGLTLFVGVPTSMWLLYREGAARRWRPRVVGTTHVGDDGYRGADVPAMDAGGPPRHVHITAMMCWILGTMFVPGLVGGLVGLIAMGVGLVSIPGLILAARLFALGAPLLRAEPQAAEKARSAARFARVLNAIVLVLTGTCAALLIPDLVRFGLRGDTRGLLGICAMVAAYAWVSLTHAKRLDRAADAIDAEHAPRADAETTGVRVDLAGEAAVSEGFPEGELAAAEVVAEAAARRGG